MALPTIRATNTAGLAAPVVMGLALLLSACGGDAEPQLESAVVTVEDGADPVEAVDGADSETTGRADQPTSTSTTAREAPAAPRSPTTTEPAPSSTRQPSVEAQSFVLLAPDLVDLGGPVRRYVETVDPVDLDVLAEQACAGVGHDTTDTELGLQALQAYGQLDDDDRARLSPDDWILLYGSLIGFFCPDDLPDIDDRADRPSTGSEIERFRAAVSTVEAGPGRSETTGPEDHQSTVSEGTAAFVGLLDDRRLSELRATVCTGTEPDMTGEEFGTVIIDGYDRSLSSLERQAISLDGFGELWGALVGWFCPANLPI